MVGLVIAARNFNPSKARFSTYAYWWINQSFKRYIFGNSTKVAHIPENVIAKTFEVLSYAQDQNVTLRQACKKLYPTRIVDIEHALSILESKQSLDKPLGLEQSLNLKDILTNPQDKDPQFLLEEIVYLFEQCELSKKEKEILCKRYGIYGPSLTLDTLGKEYSLSRERIRQIESRALRKLESFVRSTDREFPLEKRSA